MYTNWFTWTMLFDAPICYMKKLGVTIIIKLSQRNGQLPLPH